MVFSMFVAPTSVKAQEIGTYAYEDVTKQITVTCGSFGNVKFTAYTRYSSNNQKYTFLRYTYEPSLKATYPLASVQSVECNFDNGDVIDDNIKFTVKIKNLGSTYTYYGTIQML